MELWTGALNLGFLYSLMALGVYITFRIYDFPDITVDGSFTTGASVAAVVIISGGHPLLAIGAAFIAGFLAGFLTAIIHTGLKINGLLAGILVMTALYSINLHIMGRSNIPLLNQFTVFTIMESINPGLNSEVWTLIVLLVMMTIIWFGISIFFKTDLGLAMRVTGNNPAMGSANGISTNKMIWLGLGLSNGLVGVSGGLVAQFQGFSDIGMGVGTIVAGLAAVIIGESVLNKKSIYFKILCVFIGSILFRFMIAFALYVGLNPLDLKLITAVFVLATLYFASSKFKTTIKSITAKLNVKFWRIIILIAALVISGFFIIKSFNHNSKDITGHYKIGFLQKEPVKVALFLFNDQYTINEVADGVMSELDKDGFLKKNNIIVDRKNAQNEFSLAQSVATDIVARKYDYIITLSTPALQVMANANQTIPHIFGFVTDPYKVRVAVSSDNHLPYITGVATLQPVESTIKMMRKLLPDAKRIGMIWNPAEVCSETCTMIGRDVIGKYDFELIEATVSTTGEIYDALNSLLAKDIDIFFTSGDNTVMMGLDPIAQKLQDHKIPYFTNSFSDIERGAFLSIGADYAEVGEETGKIARMVVGGADPADIPIYDFVPEKMYINLALAKEYGIVIPDDVIAKAAKVKR